MAVEAGFSFVNAVLGSGHASEYKFQDIIGRGTFGVVFSALTKDSKHVAVKVSLSFFPPESNRHVKTPKKKKKKIVR